MAERRFVVKMIFVTGGLLIWGAQFTVLYVFNALVCARRLDQLSVAGLGIVPLVVVASTALAAAAGSWVLFQAITWRRPTRDGSHDNPASAFLRYTTITISLLALVAIVWNGVPALVVPPCG